MAWMQTPQWKALQKNNFIQKLESTWYRIPWSKQKWILMQKRKTALAVFLFLLYIRKRKEERGEALLFLKNVVWWKSTKKFHMMVFWKNSNSVAKRWEDFFQKRQKTKSYFWFFSLDRRRNGQLEWKKKGKNSFLEGFSLFLWFFLRTKENPPPDPWKNSSKIQGKCFSSKKTK